MEKVSIIIPIYNTKMEYLIECVDSVKEQTYNEIEILMIDDGSNKDTAQLCDEIGKTDDRIIVFHKKNEGVSKARNFGIEKASGKWIFFIDSDDWIESNTIKKLVEISEENEIILFSFFLDENKIDNTNNQIINNNTLIDALFFQNSFQNFILESACNKLYSKKFLKDYGISFPINISRGEDMLFNLEAYKKANKIKCNNYYTYHYRTNNDSATRIFDKEYVEKNNALIKAVKEKLELLGDTNYEEYFDFFVVRHLHNACRMYVYNKQNFMDLKERKEYIKNLVSKFPYNVAIKRIKLRNLSYKRMVLVLLLRLKLFNILPYVYKNYLYN